MTKNTYYQQLNLKDKIKKQKRNRLMIQRTFSQVPDGRGAEEWVKKVKGLRSMNWLLQNSQGRYSRAQGMQSVLF